MKLIWLSYLVYSLGNCVMKLCIETGLIRRGIGLGHQGGGPSRGAARCCGQWASLYDMIEALKGMWSWLHGLVGRMGLQVTTVIH